MNASGNTAIEHFQAARLAEAIAAATATVKANPADAASRGLLCELLCFAGDLERADKQLDAIGQLDPTLMVAVASFRNLLRGEQARLDFFRSGCVPEFMTPPSPELQLRLRASILLRENDAPGAALLLEQAETARPRVAGQCNGSEFDDLRDLDDLTASFFEVLTSTGKYYWAPFDQIQSISFHPVERPLDLLWRKANLSVRNGPDGEVFIPALYPDSAQDPDERIRLGKITEWRGGDGVPVRGLGQRMFLCGEASLPILELKQIEFHAESTA